MPTTPSMPVLAKGKTRTGRLWTYVCDDRPFGGPKPAAAFFYSLDRGGEDAERLANCAGLMQADSHAGFNRLYEPGHKPGPIIEAACWAHARRKFFDLALLSKASIAIDALFAIEREINGMTLKERQRIRPKGRRSLLVELETWLPGHRSSSRWRGPPRYARRHRFHGSPVEWLIPEIGEDPSWRNAPRVMLAPVALRLRDLPLECAYQLLTLTLYRRTECDFFERVHWPRACTLH
jgi:hypothetical protein